MSFNVVHLTIIERPFKDPARDHREYLGLEAGPQEFNLPNRFPSNTEDAFECYEAYQAYYRNLGHLAYGGVELIIPSETTNLL